MPDRLFPWNSPSNIVPSNTTAVAVAVLPPPALRRGAWIGPIYINSDIYIDPNNNTTSSKTNNDPINTRNSSMSSICSRIMINCSIINITP
jgi:hypothetical protein